MLKFNYEFSLKKILKGCNDYKIMNVENKKILKG
jgi:hypothetical protein